MGAASVSGSGLVLLKLEITKSAN